MGWLFQFFFKYPAFVFEQGDFTFAASRSMTLIGPGAFAALAAAALITYRGITSEGTGARPRWCSSRCGSACSPCSSSACSGRRSSCKAAVPQQNFLGILIDDSRSMTIADRDGQPRTEFVQKQLGRPSSPLLEALSERFVLRFFRFSSAPIAWTTPADLKYAGTVDAARPGARARARRAGRPAARRPRAWSPTAPTPRTQSLDESLASLKARSIPVFTVGVGQERFERDIQITRVETPRSTLKGTSLAVDVVVTQTGYAGETVPLHVEDEGRIVSSQDVTLPADGESTTVRVTFTAARCRARACSASGSPRQPDEQVTQNNSARRARRGARPRENASSTSRASRGSEAKFIRRAVEDDKNLQVVRPAADRRGQVPAARRRQPRRAGRRLPEDARGAVRLSRDHPRQRRSRVVLARSAAHARRLRQQARRRPADARRPARRSPKAAGPARRSPKCCRSSSTPRPPRGENAPEFFTHLVGAPDARRRHLSRSRSWRPTETGVDAQWNDMPAVSAVNPMRAVKPGATVLLTGATDDRQEQVVLAYQRYGRGKALAFPIQDSWIWKMDATMAGRRHDARDVLAAAGALARRRRARSGRHLRPPSIASSRASRCKLTAEVVDPAFVEVNDAQVIAAGHGAVRQDDRGAARVDRVARRRIQGHVRPRRDRDSTR